MAKDDDSKVAKRPSDDHRETLKLLAQILEGSRERESQMREALDRVTGALTTMTTAFEKQSSKVSELLDLRTDFSKLKTAYYESERRNEKLRNRMEFIGSLVKPGVLAIITLFAIGLANLAGLGK